MISGILTLLAFVAFLGIVRWAWSARNVDRFAQASRLPLDDEDNGGAQRGND